MADAKTRSTARTARRAPPLRAPARAGGRVAQSLAALIRPQASTHGAAPQAKLRVGAANDPAEAEADRVAERVLSGPAPGLAAPAPAPPAGQPLRRSAMDQPGTEALAQTPPLPAEQQEIKLPENEDVKTEALDTSDIDELDAGAPQDSAPAAQPRRAAEPAGAPVVGPEGGDAPARVAARIEAPGPGRPLPAALRAELEPRFGADFSDVRLHDRPEDRATAEAIGARAFAYRSDIWLGEGERADDRRLVAHELTHVLQQTGRARSPLTARGKDDAQPQRQPVRRFLGDAILAKIEKYARHIPGYTFISYLLGKSPITGKPVQKTAENLIYALLGLIPFGTLLADRLKETRALQRAYDWVTGRLSKLNLSWTRVKQTIAKAKELFSIWSPLKSIRPAFAPLIRDIVTFCLEVKDKVQEFILRGALALAGPWAEKVWGVIKGAGRTIGRILEDPIAFAKNLFKAVGQGFGRFFDNFGKHLKKGILGFIFGSLEGLDLKLPEKLDLKGILSLVFQILGLTWDRIRKQLVKRLNPGGEKKVSLLEKAVDVLKLLVTKGIMGVWQKLVAMIDNLVGTVIGGISSFLTGTLVKAALGWLAGLTNPVGAVIKVILTIYNFVVMLIERMQQIMELVSSVFGSIARIAAGNVAAAAGKIEQALARTIPLILAFLAAIIPVNGITTAIRRIFAKLRKPVDRAIGKFLKFVVRKSKKVLARLIGKVNAKRKLPGTTFKVGKKTHQLFAEPEGKKRVEVFVKSRKKTTDKTSLYLKSEGANFTKHAPKREQKDVLAFIQAFDKETDEVEGDADKVDLTSKTASQKKTVEELERELADGQKALTEYGIRLDGHSHVYTGDPERIIRFRMPVTGFEGATGNYSALSDRKKALPENEQEYAKKLQLDHNPNRATLGRIQEELRAKGSAKTASERVFFQQATGRRDDDITTGEGVFGRLSKYTVNDTADLPAIAIYGAINNAMKGIDEAQGAAMGGYLKANGLTDLAGLKGLVGEQMEAKIDKTRTLYKAHLAKDSFKSDDAAKKTLKANIETGLNNLRTLARTELRLTGKRPGKRDLAPLPSELVRFATPKTRPDGAPDFVTAEGSAGNYSSLSGTHTKVGMLEADHSPMHADMKVAGKWTVKDVLRDPDAAIAATRAHEKIAGLPAAEKTAAEARVAAAIRDAPLNTGDEKRTYGHSKAGAVVVGYDVNQHDKMAVPTADLTGKAQAAADGIFDDARKGRMASAAAAGKPRDEVADDTVRAANRMVRVMLRKMIVERQQMAYNIYGTVELPKIKQANPGALQKPAVGLMARIAARVKSAQTINTLASYTDRWFPT